MSIYKVVVLASDIVVQRISLSLAEGRKNQDVVQRRLSTRQMTVSIFVFNSYMRLNMEKDQFDL